MGEIVRRPRFIEDIEAVWDYIAGDSVVHADGFIRELEQKYQMLSDSPLIGVAKLDDMPHVRFFPHKRYMIVYAPLPENTGIELIRLFQAAQDWHEWLQDDI
ncbi:MAG: type II toxin-antitoxin system RelE/ParE family toxin [Proteobacteria bacterium]|nr:type II toxin-antitoxin system RelE/ParE family toxin [Pseudomonadota bacterium]